MTNRTARLKLGPSGPGVSVEVDGHELAQSVRGLRVTASVHDLPRLELDLVEHEIVVEGEMRVEIPPKTREALIALGWTPPTVSKPTTSQEPS